MGSPSSEYSFVRAFLARALSFVLGLGCTVQTGLGAGPTLLISSDLQGVFWNEEGVSDRPGLTRLVSLFAETGAEDTLRVDAGNFFAYADAPLTSQQLLEIPDLSGYDVLHLTGFDVSRLLRGGWNGALPASANAELISANLFRPDGTTPFAQRSIVREMDGLRVGLTGIFWLDERLQDLPAYAHLKPDMSIRAPVEALEEVLAHLQGTVDQVILFYSGDPRGLFELKRAFGDEIDVFIQGPLLPFAGNFPAEGVFQVPSRFGSHLLKLDLSAHESELIALRPGARGDASLTQKLQALGVEPSVDPTQETQKRLPASLPAGESAFPLRILGQNRALRWQVREAQFTPLWQERAAPPGYQFLILSTVAENRKPRDLIAQDSGQRALLFGFLNEALVLLHNGRRAIPLHPEQESFAGALPFSFVLPGPRTRAEGDLVFLIPEEEPESLELRHYHIEYEVVSLVLKGDPSEALDPEWASSLPGNNFFGFELRGIEEIPPSTPGLPESPGTRWIAVDVAGYSRLTRSNPANHYRTDLDVGTRIETGRITPYLRADEHIQIVTSDGFTYRPQWDLGTFPRVASFLPDRLTEGRLIFALPEDTGDYRVSLYFPNMGTITEGLAGFQAPVFFEPGEQPLSFQIPEPELDFGLEILAVELIEVATVEGTLRVDAVITNQTPEPGFWEMEERFGLNPVDSRDRIRATSMTDSFGNELPWFFHLPPGEPRRLILSFPLPEGIQEALLDVRGVEDNPTIRITWGEDSLALSIPDDTPSVEAEAPHIPAPGSGEAVAEAAPAAPAKDENEGTNATEEDRPILEPRIAPPFDQHYRLRDLGPVPGVPPRYAGLMVWPEDYNYLLIGGDAIEPEGALYKIRLDRDEEGHIQGFIGEAEKFIETPYIDGGLVLGPGEVIFYARYPVNQIGLVSPGSRQTDKVIPLRPFRVNRSIAGLGFVPEGFPNAGAFRLVTWPTGIWFGGEWTPDEDGLFELTTAGRLGRYQGGPASFVYIAPGSPEFDEFSLLMTDFSANRISAYTIDDEANPIHRSRRNFIVDLEKAEGAYVDPLTGDFLFSTFEIRDRVIAVSGFSIPESSPLYVPPSGDGQLILTLETSAEQRFYFILDGSGSLMAPLGGERNFDIARRALLNAVEQLGDNTEVALRAFGNRKRAIEEGADKDTTLEVPMMPLDEAHRTRLVSTLQRLRPMGRTPLTLALAEARADIDKLRGIVPTRVILLSDGADDIIPRVDPGPVAADLTRPDHVELSIIVFEQSNELEIAQLQSIADLSGADLRFSATGNSLVQDVLESVNAGPRNWSIQDEDGNILTSGEGEAELILPPGDYLLIVGDPENPRGSRPFTMPPAGTVRKEL